MDLGRVGMQCRYGRYLGGRCAKQLRPAGLEVRQLLLEPGGLQPVGNRLDEVCELALDHLQLTPARSCPGRGLGRETVPFLDEGCAEFGNQFRLHQA